MELSLREWQARLAVGTGALLLYRSLLSPCVPAHRMSKKSAVGEPEDCPVEDSVIWLRPGCLLQVPLVTQWELFQVLLLTKVGETMLWLRMQAQS